MDASILMHLYINAFYASDKENESEWRNIHKFSDFRSLRMSRCFVIALNQ